MTTQNVVLPLPESQYLRFQRMAEATRQSLVDVLLRAVEVGSPPVWEDAPAAYQADLAALDRLDDTALWRVARSRRDEAEMERLQDLLDRQADGVLTPLERIELDGEIAAADRLMLCKAHAVALLRWRGHVIPPAEQL
jgi:hypothetical protein